MHLLVPHKPYGFNKNCEYESKLSNLNIFMSKKEHILQHNIERDCVVKLIDQMLKNINSIDNYKIIILSDHGSRITRQKNSSLSTIFSMSSTSGSMHQSSSDCTAVAVFFFDLCCSAVICMMLVLFHFSSSIERVEII